MKRVYVDMDGVLCDIAKQHQTYKKIFPTQPYPQSQYGFFYDMDPIKDAIDSVNLLMKHFDVWILTAPSYKNPMCLTEKNMWIRKYFGIEFTEKIIICSDKSLCKGDYLIDDNKEGRGQNNFEGELILFGSNEFPTWDIVIDYLIPPISTIREDAIYIGKSRVDSAPMFQFGIDKWKEKNGEIIQIKNDSNTYDYRRK